MENRKPYKDLTKKEILDRKEKVCVKCKYSSITNGRSIKKKSELIYLTCDYILIEGHRRGCDPRDCVEKGVFKPKGSFKRRVGPCVTPN